MTYKPLLPLAFGLLLCATPIQASTTDGFLIGGFAGLTAGLITSAVAHHAKHHRRRHHHHCHTMREPVVIEREPVLIQQPIIRERIVEQPIVMRRHVRHVVQYPQPQQITVPASPQSKNKPFQERELALKEQQLKLDLLKEENRKRELHIREMELEYKVLHAKKSS